MKCHVFSVILVVATLANEGLTSPGDPHFCKTEVIQKIENIWAGNPPTGIIDHLKSIGEERVVLASEHYTDSFKRRHSHSDLKCFYAKWDSAFNGGKGGLEFALIRFSKTRSKNVKEGKVITIVEENGVTKCPKESCKNEREARRFYSKDGVIGIYMCSPHGRDLMAKPDGFIKVRKDLFNADGSYKDASVGERVQEAKAKAAEIGIVINKEIAHVDCEATAAEELEGGETK